LRWTLQASSQASITTGADVHRFSQDEQALIGNLPLLRRARTTLLDDLAREFGHALGHCVARYAEKLGLHPVADEYNTIEHHDDIEDRGRYCSWQDELQAGFQSIAGAGRTLFGLQGASDFPYLDVHFLDAVTVELTIPFEEFAVHIGDRKEAMALLRENKLLPILDGEREWQVAYGKTYRSSWQSAHCVGPWQFSDKLFRGHVPSLETIWPDLADALRAYATLSEQFASLPPETQRKLLGKRRSQLKPCQFVASRNTRRLSDEETFLLDTLPVLSRADDIWSPSHSEGLCQRVQETLATWLVTECKPKLVLLSPYAQTQELAATGPLPRGKFAINLGRAFFCTRNHSGVDGTPDGPILYFDLREEYLMEGTYCAVVDVRPWIENALAGDVGEARARLSAAGADNIFLNRNGPEWRSKTARVAANFYGWWTAPGALRLDLRALAEGDSSAIASAKAVIDQFVDLAERLQGLQA
jgi:hypothetical protein